MEKLGKSLLLFSPDYGPATPAKLLASIGPKQLPPPSQLIEAANPTAALPQLAFWSGSPTIHAKNEICARIAKLERRKREPGPPGVRSPIDCQAALVVAPHRDFSGAPGLERADQDRGRNRGSDEHELLKQAALNRAEGAKQREQKRYWQDRRHLGGPFGDKPSCLVASPLVTLAAGISVPSTDDRARVREFVSERKDRELSDPMGEPSAAGASLTKVSVSDGGWNATAPLWAVARLRSIPKMKQMGPR